MEGDTLFLAVSEAGILAGFLTLDAWWQQWWDWRRGCQWPGISLSGDQYHHHHRWYQVQSLPNCLHHHCSIGGHLYVAGASSITTQIDGTMSLLWAIESLPYWGNWWIRIKILRNIFYIQIQIFFSLICLNLKTCSKSKHKHVKMMSARKCILKRPMLITKAINFHLKREQIANCLPFEILLILRFSACLLKKCLFICCKCTGALFPKSPKLEASNVHF